jgi:hypothetical protein
LVGLALGGRPHGFTDGLAAALGVAVEVGPLNRESLSTSPRHEAVEMRAHQTDLLVAQSVYRVGHAIQHPGEAIASLGVARQQKSPDRPRKRRITEMKGQRFGRAELSDASLQAVIRPDLVGVGELLVANGRLAATPWGRQRAIGVAGGKEGDSERGRRCLRLAGDIGGLSPRRGRRRERRQRQDGGEDPRAWMLHQPAAWVSGRGSE